MDFYLTYVPILHETSGEPKCANCDKRGQYDDACHILFQYLTFQLYQEDVMTTIQETGEQPLTPNSLVPILLRSAEGWDQVASFVALTMHWKMELE